MKKFAILPIFFSFFLGIQVQVEEVEDTLRKTKAELGVLMSYKDKEYPVRAMRISELQRQIDYLTVEFEVSTGNNSTILTQYWGSPHGY